MAYTPLTLTAVDYLSNSHGLVKPTQSTLPADIVAYRAVPIVKLVQDIISTSGFNTSAFYINAQAKFPGLVDAVPLDNTYVKINTSPTFSGATVIPGVPTVAPIVVGGGFSYFVVGLAASYLYTSDYSKIFSLWNIANGYIAQTNEIIDTVKKSASSNAVFKGTDAAMSGNLSLVSSDLQKFAADLEKTGEFFENPADPYSNPLRVVRRVFKANGKIFVTAKLLENGLTQDEIDLIDSDEVVSNVTIKKLYTAFTKIDGEVLISILSLLSITTNGLATLADVFDLKKMFPTSYTTLKAKTKLGTVELFGRTTVNASDLLTTPDYYIPENLVVELTAFATSLQQIVGINNLSMSSIAKTAKTIQLSAISGKTTAVEPATVTSLNATHALGTGTDNKLVLADVLGTSIGYTHSEQFAIITKNLNKMTLGGLYLILDTLKTLMTTTTYYVAPNWVIPVGKPAAGTYTSQNLARDQLLVLANTELTNILTTNATLVAECNKASATVVKRITHESALQTKAGINATAAQSSPMAVMTFAQGLHKIGEDTTIGGERMILTQLVDTTAAGQTIIACMKEGQNIKQMQNNGLATTNFI